MEEIVNYIADDIFECLMLYLSARGGETFPDISSINKEIDCAAFAHDDEQHITFQGHGGLRCDGSSEGIDFYCARCNRSRLIP